MVTYATMIKDIHAMKQMDCSVHSNKDKSLNLQMELIAFLKIIKLVTRIKGLFAILKTRINARSTIIPKTVSLVMA